MSFERANALDNAIQAVANKLLSIDGIGKVNSYIRALNTEQQFQDAFKDEKSGKIHGWTVTRDATGATDKGISAVSDMHNVIVRGYLGVQDAENSERDFQMEIEHVRDVFIADRKLGGAIYYSSPMTARSVVTGMLGGYLVHYCELVLPCEVYPLVS